MKTVIVHPGHMHNYLEVWEITEWRDGHIYRTKQINRFILAEDKHKLNKDTHIAVSPSTSLLCSSRPVEIALWIGENQ